MQNKKNRIRLILEIGLISAIIIKLFFWDCMKISGDSMLNTFHDGDIVLLDKTVDEFDRNDIVVAYYQFGIFHKKIIKRVIGLPNEKVQIIKGSIYVNDEKLSNDIDVYIEEAGIASVPVYLGEDEYFLLGDNRNNSNDSRSNEIGIIPKSHIVGLVLKKMN